MMSLEEGDDDHADDLSTGGEGGENETSKRSERKRQREKQRRTDLTKSFDELASFIFHIEPEAGDPDVDAKKKRKKNGAGSGAVSRASDQGDEASGITRLDLIGRALRIMKRLHRENEERKRMIEHMRERRSGPQSNDNVLVMVPTLSPADDPSPVARASYPPYYHPHHHQGGGQPPLPSHPPEYMIPIQGRHPPSYPPHGGGSSHHQQHSQPPSHWAGYGRGPATGGGHPQQGSYPSSRSSVPLPNAHTFATDGRSMR